MHQIAMCIEHLFFQGQKNIYKNKKDGGQAYVKILLQTTQD